MDARAKTVRDILHTGDQYIIPLFQRYYSWTRKHWERLWNDLLALVEGEPSSQHFLGPLVCTPSGHVPTEIHAYQLIDGQQRLATLTVLLAAMRDVATEHGLNELAEEITEDYLLHKRKKGTDRYKVVPRLGDREALVAIVENRDEKEYRKFGITRAKRHFRRRIAKWVDANSADALPRLFQTVAGRLSLVVITIDGENPYEIFESLNSTGLPLEESDLIRNYVFMQVDMPKQDEFNTEHWGPFEALFDETDNDPAIPATQFYRDYVMRNGRYSKRKMTFVDFKGQNKAGGLSPVDQVAELRRFAGYEVMLRRPSTCAERLLRRMLSHIAMLDISTAHPLLMNLLDRHASGSIELEALLGCFEDLCSFVMRRTVCGETTRPYGRWFTEAITGLNGDVRETLRKYLVGGLQKGTTLRG